MPAVKRHGATQNHKKVDLTSAMHKGLPHYAKAHLLTLYSSVLPWVSIIIGSEKRHIAKRWRIEGATIT